MTRLEQFQNPDASRVETQSRFEIKKNVHTCLNDAPIWDTLEITLNWNVCQEIRIGVYKKETLLTHCLSLHLQIGLKL